jgi:hypothetical protein
MKRLFYTIVATGFVLASCGSNKTEGEATSADSVAVDTISSAAIPISNSTGMSKDTANIGMPNDTVRMQKLGMPGE